MGSGIFWTIILFSLSAYSAEIDPAVNVVLEADLNALPGQEGNEIRYGYDVLRNTAKYYGPKGIVGRYTESRVSCSQCHMEAGTKPFGNSFLDTHSLYPQYRVREREIQTLSARINACFTHPLLGKRKIPEDSREMKGLLMYIKWVGRGRPILEKDPDQRLVTINFLERAADPEKGRAIFEAQCISCHGKDGQGQLNSTASAYLYPPLWGKESFMLGSSMSRLSVLARFIKGNMPFGRDPSTAGLSDEESWDVSAFVMSKPRPPWVGKKPFTHLSDKPYDYPMGPFEDKFSLQQHRLGPFLPILEHIQKTKKDFSPLERTGI